MAISKSNGTVAEAPVSRPLPTNGRDDSLRTSHRDYEAEARGKVACTAFNAALMSPGIAGLSYTNIDELLAHVKKAADASVEYTWAKQKAG